MARLADIDQNDRRRLAGAWSILVQWLASSASALLSRHALAVILLLGCLHGLLYVYLMPPWQHYDEPGHFEYAWLIANRGRLPQPGDRDPGMRIETVASMSEHVFYRGVGDPPSLLQPAPLDIGLSHLRHPPLYYVLASLPLFALRYTDITLQLYAARLVSLVLFLVTIVAAWGLVGELVSPASSLRWMVPASLALLPGFVDLMTAVNNDVGAVAVFSLFLWGAVRLIQRGTSLGGLLWLLGAALLCYWTKDTVFIALPLLPPVLLFGLARGKWRTLAWGLVGATVVVGLLAVFSWGGAALWYDSTNQNVPVRDASAQAPLGHYAFRVGTGSDKSVSQVLQLIPSDQLQRLRGKLVTLGAWVWADKPVRAKTPILVIDKGVAAYSANVDIGTSPGYHAFTVAVPEESGQAWIALAPQTVASDEGVGVFYDGIVLAEGERPQHEAPHFTDDNGQGGTWGGRPFENLVRNGSAEMAGPTVRAWVDKAAARYSVIEPSMMLAALLDWQGAAWYWRAAAPSMLQTFWAKLGWAHIALYPYADTAYSLLALVTLVGFAGTGVALWTRRRHLPWSSVFFLGLVLIGVWGIALMRGVSTLWSAAFIPVARYGFPAIVPAGLVLNVGWAELLKRTAVNGRSFAKLPYLLYGLFFLALDGFAVVSILHYYGSG